MIFAPGRHGGGGAVENPLGLPGGFWYHEVRTDKSLYGSKEMNERIGIDPNICHGQACIKGTRMPVHQIIGMLANGDTIETLLQEYPSIEREDILACLDYAAALAQEQVAPLGD